MNICLHAKFKSEFSLNMGLMVINHSNPYIHSTTVLCDEHMYCYYNVLPEAIFVVYL